MGLSESGDCLFQLLLGMEDEAEVEVGLGEIGLEGNGLSESGDGLVQLVLVAQSDAELVVRPGVVGLEVDGLPVGDDRLVQFLLGMESEAEVEVRVGVIGLEVMALRKAASGSSSFFWSPRARSSRPTTPASVPCDTRSSGGSCPLARRARAVAAFSRRC